MLNREIILVVSNKKFSRLLFVILIGLFMAGDGLLQGCAPKVIHSSSGFRGSTHQSRKDSPLGLAIVKTARSQIGRPYKWGGKSPNEGFDCSGFVWWVYSRHGVNLPRMTGEQIKAGRSVKFSELRAGDIVFFKVSFWGKSLHEGIYSGKNSFFIHSPKSGNHVREESITSSYWRKSFIEARRVIK